MATVLAAAYWLVAPPSADLAAQDYRAGLGLAVWDAGWYGGHHVLGYSVLYPLLASLLGPRAVGALSAVAAAWLFERLVDDMEGGRAASLWFAVATVSSLLTGRLTFALGVAVGLGAVLAAARGRPGLACALAALTALASPVAGAFVALAGVAWWIARRDLWPVGVAIGGVVPTIVLAVVFPEGGTFPFAASSFWPTLAVAVAVVLAVPRDARVLRFGAALYALAIIASYALKTPMGGNVVRLGALFAGPALAALLWRRNRRALALLALPLLYWQWVAPIDDWAQAASDPSVHQRYYTGVLGFFAERGEHPFRVEIPFTKNHYEARWVARQVPLARGWDRQLDIARNPVFYSHRYPLTAARYRRWLQDNAVRYVALADAPVDYSAAREAALVRSGLPYLHEVWRDAHWRVFAVRDARPLASGAATITSLDDNGVRLQAHRAGYVDLRVHYTSYWQITAGDGCVAKGAGGWTRLHVDSPGPEVVLKADFSLGRVRATSPRCTPDPTKADR